MYSDNTWMLWHTTLPEIDCFCYTHTTCDVTENGVRYIEVHREYNILKRHVIEWCCTDLMWLSIPCSFYFILGNNWYEISSSFVHWRETKSKIGVFCYVFLFYFVLFTILSAANIHFKFQSFWDGIKFSCFLYYYYNIFVRFFLFFHSWFVDVSDSINEAKWFAFQSKCSSPSTMYNI